jgi:hypothetical protein
LVKVEAEIEVKLKVKVKVEVEGILHGSWVFKQFEEQEGSL